MADLHDFPPDRLDDATIARYLAGNCDPAECARVERWLNADPAHRDELAALRAAWDPAAVGEVDPDDRMWQWIAQRMDEPLPRPRVVPSLQLPSAQSSGRRRSISAIAAIAAAMIAVIGGTLLLGGPGRKPNAGSNTVVAHEEMRELVAPRGTRVTGNLPDGSRVILAPETKLRVSKTFAAVAGRNGLRDVYLVSGEAFFEVTHDSMRPFRVHTPNGIAEDLGTEFVVSAYPETQATRVVVASGLVELRRRDARLDTGVRLEAGDLGRIEASGRETMMRNVDVSAYISWTDGSLTFDEAPIQEAAATLSRWYDVEIQLADPTMARRRFTASFHDEPIAEVLRVLEIALNARAERTGQLVVLRPR